MVRFFSSMCFSVLIWGASSAAPPTLTHLYPAGAKRGTTAEVTAAGTFDRWPVKVWASGNGVTAAAGRDKGKLLVTVAADAAPGVYWLRAYTDDGASGLRPFIVGTLPEVAEAEPNDEAKAAQVVADSAVVNGRLAKSGDVDCYAVALRKGQTLVASVEANATLRSPMDAILQVVTPDGFVVAENHDFRKLDPQLAFTAPRDGTYVARVFAFPSNPDSTIRFAGGEAYVYRLTLTTGGFADYPVPLAVSRENPDTVSQAGWNIPAAAKTLDVKPTAADVLTLFHPAVANSVRLRVERHPCFDFTAKPSAAPLTPPVSVTGRIEAPGGEVAVPFAGRKGGSLSIRAASRELGLAVNPVVRVVGPDGKSLARGEPARVNDDTTVNFTPPADGTYTAVVSDLFGGGGTRHVFLLRVSGPEPDYELTVTTDRFNVPPGKSLDIPVTVTRRAGFTKSVEVVAEQLPDGVTVETKPPTGKVAPNAVTLTIGGPKAGVTGPLLLVGRVKDEPALTRPVRAALPEFETMTTDCWVTVSTVVPVTSVPSKK